MKCKSRTFVKLGAKDAKVECKVKMNPPPKMSTWAFGKLPNRTVLQMGDSSAEYSAQMTVSYLFISAADIRLIHPFHRAAMRTLTSFLIM